MRRLLCRLAGHRWVAVYVGETSACMVCTRCKDNGWRL